jgi:hypothetical protein
MDEIERAYRERDEPRDRHGDRDLQETVEAYAEYIRSKDLFNRGRSDKPLGSQDYTEAVAREVFGCGFASDFARSDDWGRAIRDQIEKLVENMIRLVQRARNFGEVTDRDQRRRVAKVVSDLGGDSLASSLEGELKHVEEPGLSEGEVRVGGTDYLNLTESQKVFVATIASEAIGQDATAWVAVGHVIMNRAADGIREWRNLNTVTEVVQQPWAFSGVHQQSGQFLQALEYLNNRTGTDLLYESLIETVLPIYLGIASDTTDGAVLFYSPRSMIPADSMPPWDFNQLTEITIAGINPWYFRFFKYK